MERRKGGGNLATVRGSVISRRLFGVAAVWFAMKEGSERSGGSEGSEGGSEMMEGREMKKVKEAKEESDGKKWRK